jgi:hypothetical protein
VQWSLQNPNKFSTSNDNSQMEWHAVSKHQTEMNSIALPSWYNIRHSFVFCLPPPYRYVLQTSFKAVVLERNRWTTLIGTSDDGLTNHHFHYAFFCSILSLHLLSHNFRESPFVFFNNSSILSVHLIHFIQSHVSTFITCLRSGSEKRNILSVCIYSNGRSIPVTRNLQFHSYNDQLI